MIARFEEIDRAAWKKAPLSMCGATFFGVGHLRGGPGTYAAILFLPGVWGVSLLDFPVRLVVFAVATIASIYVSERADHVLEEHDSRKVVIDEVVGVWLAMLLYSNLTLTELVVGCVAFRFFDIAKPWPIRQVDERLGGGLGVVVDDLVAGLFALPFVYGLRLFLA